MLVPVILSGGSGTRLWPVSRHHFPKQFHKLTEWPGTLFQQTALRALGLATEGNMVVICNEDHRFLVTDQLKDKGINQAQILLEPQPLNTAPATAVAALYLQQNYGTVTLLILPSDHVIACDENFQRTVEAASISALQGKLVTFGVIPNGPETGYGYIKRGAPLADSPGYHLEKFIEKPTKNVAKTLIQSGNYLWNSGIFLFQNDIYLEELNKWRPEIYKSCEEATSKQSRDQQYIRVDPDAFSRCPSDSIDYAVMENTNNAIVVPLETFWSDIGSWSQLAKVLDQDEGGNVTKGDVITYNVKDSYIHSEQRLIAAVGIENTVIVETDDVVLVVGKTVDQEVKMVVQKLNDQHREVTMNHTLVHRPWGCFQTLDSGEGFQVKRLVVNPGASISLQLHRKRSEHWVVVKGEATVTLDEQTFSLQPNESTYIPVNTKHKLENKGNLPLEVVEVQTGTYLGEDDIERFEDRYGRV